MSNGDSLRRPTGASLFVRAMLLSHTRYGRSERQLASDIGRYGMPRFAWALVAFVTLAGTAGGVVVWRDAHSGVALAAILMVTHLFAFMIASMAVLARKTPRDQTRPD